MKRRDFLKTAAVTTAATSVSVVSSCTNESGPKPIQYLELQSIQVTTLHTLENEFLKVEIRSDASTTIYDKVNNKQWESGPVALQELGPVESGHVWLRGDRSMCEQFPGRFVGTMRGNDFEFKLIGRQNRLFGSFACTISLEKEFLVYKLSKIDSEIQSLSFPTPITSEALILPNGIGKIIRDTEHGGIYTRHAQTFYTHLNMRWTGGLKGDAGWIGIYDEGFEDAGAMIANRNVAPLWMKSLGKWSHPYVYKMKFVKGDYVTLAKEYRAWFIAKGLFKMLEEKRKENPALNSFIGGRVFWTNLAHPAPKKSDLENFYFTEEQSKKRGTADDVNVQLTFAQAQEHVSRYRKLGMKKGFVKIAGWINRGYDASHPDVWPPEPKLGTIDELKALLKSDDAIAMGPVSYTHLDVYKRQM